MCLWQRDVDEGVSKDVCNKIDDNVINIDVIVDVVVDNGGVVDVVADVDNGGVDVVAKNSHVGASEGVL